LSYETILNLFDKGWFYEASEKASGSSSLDVYYQRLEALLIEIVRIYEQVESLP
jgi:hypothetical protein